MKLTALSKLLKHSMRMILSFDEKKQLQYISDGIAIYPSEYIKTLSSPIKNRAAEDSDNYNFEDYEEEI